MPRLDDAIAFDLVKRMNGEFNRLRRRGNAHQGNGLRTGNASSNAYPVAVDENIHNAYINVL